MTLPNIMTGLFVSRNLQKSGFLPVCQPVFCKFLERMAPVTPARFTFGYGLGHNIIWIYACDQSRKYVNHVMLWLCYITVPWEFPGGSPRDSPRVQGTVIIYGVELAISCFHKTSWCGIGYLFSLKKMRPSGRLVLIVDRPDCSPSAASPRHNWPRARSQDA